MVIWHRVVEQDETKIIDCVSYFTNELEEASKEVKIYGSITKQLQNLPGIYEARYSQYRQVESVVEVLEVKLKAVKTTLFTKYSTNMKRMISSTDAWKYVEGDPQYIASALLLAEVVHVRDRYLGVIKSLEQKSWSLNMIAKLRVAGIEDATI